MSRAGKAKNGKRGSSGGPAGAGGYDFQASTTAIALAHLARGVPLGWLQGLTDDTPVEVASETKGAGDDIRLKLRGGERVEVQVKKGLQAGKVQSETLVALAEALDSGQIDFGLLVVCPFSSRNVAQTLAADLVRLGDSVDSEVGALASQLRVKLKSRAADVEWICSRLRIITVSAFQQNDASVLAVRAELAHLCATQAGVLPAWNALYRDAVQMIAGRGVRGIRSVTAVLRSTGIQLIEDGTKGPAALLGRICAWNTAVHASFSILGVPKRLPIDKGWLPLKLHTKPSQPAQEGDADTALRSYHEWHKRKRDRDASTSDVVALGRFYRNAVVVAGPGTGKSTLLTRLARQYAVDGYPVLFVRARAVAAAMRRGTSFEAAVFELGLDGSGLDSSVLRTASIEDWVLLCDGLDETGADLALVAEGLKAFQLGRSACRIVVTTRPVGYRTSQLGTWRHYEIAGWATDDAWRNLRTLCESLEADIPAEISALSDYDEIGGVDRNLRALIGQSPLMLGLAAALIYHGRSLGRSRTELFKGIFALLELEPPVRVGVPPAPRQTLDLCLDHLSRVILDDPLKPADAAIVDVAAALAGDLGMTPLAAQGLTRDCVGYWESVGLVERIHFDLQALITTTHLMFAEYAAGRWLSSLEKAQAEEAVGERLKRPQWAEALVFSAANGLADVVLESRLADLSALASPERDMLVGALDILANAVADPAGGLEKRLAPFVEEALRSDDVGLACEVALAATRIAPGRLNTFVPMAERLLDAEHWWSRLSGWAILTHVSLASPRLPSAKRSLEATIGARKDQPRLQAGFLFLHDPGGDLLRQFAADVVKMCVEEEPLPTAEAFIGPLLDADGLNNFAFWKLVAPLLRSRGSSLNPFDRITGSRPSFNMEGFDDASQHAYAQLIGGLVSDELTEETRSSAWPEGRSFMNVAAISHICRWGQTTPRDVWRWKHELDSRPLRAVFDAVILTAGLDRSEVSLEAKALLARVKSGSPSRALIELFGSLPDVDVPDIDWKSIDRSRLDIEGVERALLHRSEMVVPVAATIVDAIIDEDQRRRTCRLLLARKEHLQAWAGVELAKALTKADLLGVILKEIPPEGPRASEAFRVLGDLKIPCDDTIFPAVVACLFGGDADAACEAAKYLSAVSPLSPSQLDEVERAEGHWRKTEAPYPTSGGAVPPSPRSILLEIRADHRELGLEVLLEAAADVRSDVAGVGLKELLACLQEADVDRRSFVDLVAAGQIPTKALRHIFQSEVGFSSEELETLETLFSSDHGPTRLLALEFLAKGGFSDTRRSELLSKLRLDPEPEIRARAARLSKRPT